MRPFALVLLALVLSGCAGGGSGSACEVFSPPPPMDPGAQNSERVESLSTGNRGEVRGAQDC